MSINGTDKSPSSSHDSASLTAPQHKPLISADKLKELYLAMVRLRLLNDRRKNARLRYQEASEVGSIIDLGEFDLVVALGSQGHLGQGVHSRAQASGILNSQNGNRSTSIMNGGVPQRLACAIGAGFALKKQSKGGAVVAFCESREIAASRKLLEFASGRCLPVLFVQLGSAIPRRALRSSLQMPAIMVDSSDVVAVYRVAYEALDKARRGAGPTLIQCVSAPQLRAAGEEHCSDPIVYMERYLRKKDLWTDELRKSAGVDGRLGRPKRQAQRQSHAQSPSAKIGPQDDNRFDSALKRQS